MFPRGDGGGDGKRWELLWLSQSWVVDQTPLVIQRGAAGVRTDSSAGNQAAWAPPACTQRQAVRIWPFLKSIPKEIGWLQKKCF